MQCNGGIKWRLAASGCYGMGPTCEFSMRLPTPPSPHDAPAEAGWGGGIGSVWGEHRVKGVPGVLLMLCPGIWKTACLKQRWSLVFCQKRGTRGRAL